MMRSFVRSSLAVMTAVIVTGGSALADVYQIYDLGWSGSSFGNSASASGTMTLDLTTLINPTVPGGLGGTSYYDIVSDITSLTVTVTGAGTGDGTFALSDLCACSDFSSFTYWNTNGATVNMHGNVLAQLTADSGDFSLFFTPPGPQGSNVLTLTTDALGGDPMAMTEFAVVPELSTWAMLLLGFAWVGFAGYRKAKCGKTAFFAA